MMLGRRVGLWSPSAANEAAPRANTVEKGASFFMSVQKEGVIKARGVAT